MSLKQPWKPPTLTPEKPKSSFADRLVNVARENKRKRDIVQERENKRTRTFSAAALHSAIAQDVTKESNKGQTDEWCKYTRFNLRTRVLPQSVLKDEFKGKTTYSVSDLFRLITPPLYELPEYDTPDFLVTGIVGSKSPVRQVKGREQGGNYLVVTITDLKVTVFSMNHKVTLDGY